MFEAAQMTAPISLTGLPQAAIASRAAETDISAIRDSSSLERSGRLGAIRAGSMIPVLSITNRLLMPEAFSMNSTDDGVRAWTSPPAISAAWSAFQPSAQAL